MLARVNLFKRMLVLETTDYDSLISLLIGNWHSSV